MTSEGSVGPQDGDGIFSIEEASDSQSQRDRDPVASLRDTDEESGDEDEVTDSFDLDEREAREAGVRLDADAGDEPRLD